MRGTPEADIVGTVRRVCSWSCLAAILFAHGCGGSDVKKIERHPIAGSVTLDGTPLDQGAIRFEPMSDVKDRTSAGSLIKDGKYSISQAEGLPPGKYMVSITSSEAGPALPSDPQAAMDAAAKAQPKPERIPGKYNKNTELVVEIKSGTNQHDFPLMTKSM